MIIVRAPDLEALLAGAGEVPKLFDRLFARAESRPLTPDSDLSQLLTGQAIASAALTRRMDRPEDHDGLWLRADPVGLRPDLSAVWVQPSSFDASRDRVIDALGPVFEDAGLDFDLPHPARGYVRLERLPDCLFAAPDQLQGQSMDHLLPRGPDGAYWTRLLTDAQVALHQLAREVEGLPTGLWFWGAGALPDRGSVSPRVRQLAACSDEADALADWLDLPRPSSNGADDSLLEWFPSDGLVAEDALAELADLLQPFWRRLILGRLDQLEVAGRERVWSLRPGQARRFWKRGS
ncbi:hypothetical protein [Wenzhouxiangella marina]|uniref:Uncharacterized protein n=1 Tax=Wenzhouxiangella marina TaxID=1579979 RepID=A0A0K0XWB1_9GAMM|nr:hypothetical protein [Wenzhouxiangella marina]AKS41917.1 hypothetical protein WM2015_1547 [Wenzhouxiangella marina]MBB6086316.1 hypothetical protein [Wenzhouxiangella marina]